MGPLQIRPGDRLIKNYYESLHQFGQLEFDHEGAVRSAFQALLDTWKQRRGFWEAQN
ncbi:MAG TPA: hypothetical protein VFU50_13640 [Terriglobales bacterium]|nr:hypothetical protein [Terriglobales bacterium]